MTAAGLVLGPPLGWWWVPAVGVVLIVLGVPVGLGRYAALGHAAGPGSFSVRSGWLVREQAVLQRRAVVGWQVRQSPFQRRAGLATVVACVGAGQGGYAAIDMAAAEVAGFTAAASERLGRRPSAPLTPGPIPVGGRRYGRVPPRGAVMDVDTNQPLGTPTWIDLGVPDLDRGLEFYGAVFGWESAVGPEEYGRYTDLPAAGPAASRRSPRLHDPRAVRVGTSPSPRPTATRTVRRARQAGGTVLVEPVDVMDAGPDGQLRDPVGARFALWQGRDHVGCQVVNEPGSLVRNDLVTPDPGPAREFYAAVFDFTLDRNEDMPELDFTFLRRPDGHEVGGIMGAPGRGVGLEHHFEVAGTDEAVRRAIDAGGSSDGAKDFRYGRLATITDPFGAEFSVITRPEG